MDEFVVQHWAIDVELGCFAVFAVYDHAFCSLFEVGDIAETVCVVGGQIVEVFLVLVPLLVHVLIPCGGEDGR